MTQIRYRQIYELLKSNIQRSVYPIDTYLPSEHTLCTTHNITRTTVRKALDELLNQGFIEKHRGKGSKVRERRQSLGLLTVKGFTEAVGGNVHTLFLQQPNIQNWPEDIPYPAGMEELKGPCIFFERLRSVGDMPVMLESNWFSSINLYNFTECDFVDGSFFKTLSQIFLIEVIASEQELRALFADEKISSLLKIKEGSPILQISIKFSTSEPKLNIYSKLYCNTEKYPIGNFYKH